MVGAGVPFAGSDVFLARLCRGLAQIHRGPGSGHADIGSSVQRLLEALHCMIDEGLSQPGLGCWLAG